MASKFVHFSICDGIVHFLYRQFYALLGKWFTVARFRRGRFRGGGGKGDWLYSHYITAFLLGVCVFMFRAFYQSAQFINWPAQSRNYRLGAQFINRVRNLEIESRASNERSVHVLYIA